MSAPLFLVPTLVGIGAGDLVTLEGGEGRHAVAVRRIGVGESVLVGNGAGVVASAIVREASGRDRLVVEALDVVTHPAPQPRIVVAQALPKADRGALAVELMTEVGVDAIVPWAAARCVARWEGPKVQAGREKWQATAREAGKQARRAWLPEVAGLAATDAVLDLVGAAALAVVLHEAPGGVPLGSMGLPGGGDVVLVVGPEGGISDPWSSGLCRRQGPFVRAPDPP